MRTPKFRLSDKQHVWLFVSGWLAFSSWFAFAQGNPLPAKQGEALLKTDILGVFAHPDDETGVASTLAYYSLGRTSVVANVYCTRGEGGGNMVGRQSGPALGILREAELRDCLSTLGVRYCYFLDRLDWAYTESLAATFENWGKEQTLERLVRLVRLLRPEVIITMNPAPTPGQHGHHQAAGVLATEAFSAAADPRRFPLQLTKEGLNPWQPRRLFYAGGQTNEFFSIAVDRPLPDGRTPGRVAGMAMGHHRSQAFGDPGNAAWLQRPQHFTLVKAFVPNPSTRDDLLEGLPVKDGSLTPVNLTSHNSPDLVQFEFVPRPAFVRYQQWVNEQAIPHVLAPIKSDLPLVSGEAGRLRLRVSNTGAAAIEGTVQLQCPAGWTADPETRHLRVPAGTQCELEVLVHVPAGSQSDSELSATLQSGDQVLQATTRIHPLPHGNIPRLSTPPLMNGSDQGWETIQPFHISCSNLVEGAVANAADSSAMFRLAHNGEMLFVDVEVNDDVVVTNIAPNDIKGHWRSDSVEICLDPTGRAEHTMGCYKLGIFPFDTSGVVRGARDADARQGPIEETAPNTRLLSRRTAAGYRIQVSIPFAEIGLSPATKRFGFNLIVYDGDKKNAAIGENINKSRIAWAPHPGVQGRPEDWGRMDLE